MAKRRRFTGEFKAKVALEALRGGRPIQDRAGPEKLDKGLRCVPPFIGGTEYGEASPFYG